VLYVQHFQIISYCIHLRVVLFVLLSDFVLILIQFFLLIGVNAVWRLCNCGKFICCNIHII